MSLRHKKTSGKVAPVDPTLVGGPNWDDGHVFVLRDSFVADGWRWGDQVPSGTRLYADMDAAPSGWTRGLVDDRGPHGAAFASHAAYPLDAWAHPHVALGRGHARGREQRSVDGGSGLADAAGPVHREHGRPQRRQHGILEPGRRVRWLVAPPAPGRHRDRALVTPRPTIRPDVRARFQAIRARTEERVDREEREHLESLRPRREHSRGRRRRVPLALGRRRR